MPNNRITRLDPAVASQLRSNVAIYNQGQAIEELVLNSVDAGSTTVDVLVDAPNFSFEVRDNGSGMGPDDLKMVGEQNATSKLTSFGDEVITNGFRGEALSSIATISCMEVVTKTSASHTIYSKMIQGGTILSFGPATSGTPMTRPHGTTIYVRDLFFKWPVRKKILMASNEMEDIKQRMEAIALAHPNLAFSLYDRAKGVKLMQSKKEQSLLGCFAHLFGVQRVENLCEIRGNTLSPAKLKLSGFASSPFSAGHHSKALQFMYINRRKVKHSPIQSLLRKPTTVTVDKWAVTTFNNKSEFELDDPKMAVLDDEPDDSISCSPAILTLHTSHPSSSPQSSSSSSSSSSDAQTLPVPISIPHEHKSQNRKRALSAPPYYKPSQLTVHNNPSLSITHSPPKNPPPAVKVVPPKLVIAPPKSTTSPPQQEKQTKAKKVIDISDDASDDDFSRKSNNNNDNSSDNKSDDSDNSTHSSSSSSQDNKHHKKNNYNNSKSKKYDKATNNINKFKYKTHSENKYESDGSDVEVAKIDFGLSSSDSSDAENTKMKEKRSNKNESHSSSSSSKNKRKHNSDDDVAHHCHHSDGDYADPDPKPTKKYKKGMKKWDQKRHFTVPTFGDEDAPDDSYAAKVKRSIDEIYRIPDDGETPISISKDTVREMYVVGQADNKFVVTRAGNILFMVDQHAADERVRLERLETAVGSASGCGQFTLAKPQKWALAPHEARAAESYKSQLENWGFRWDVSSSDENMLIVRQIPTLFDTKLTMHDFREFIAQLDETKGSNHTRPNAITRILNFKACRGAVMFGDPLSQAECGVLIDQVSQCKLPFQCAHGRPSMHPVIDMTKLPPTPPPKPRRGLGGLLLLPPP